MDTNNSAWGWIAGLAVVVLIIAGIWWFAGGAAGIGTNATSTPDGAATTTGQTPTTSQENRTSQSVSAVIASLPNTLQFASLYASTGVAASISGAGPYTVFVPSDAAFANLPPGTVSGLTAAEKKRLVQYHVVQGKMLDFDAVWTGNHTALSNDSLNFNVNPQNKVIYVGSGYAVTQYRASNGIVYVINAVLIPPQTGDAGTGATGTPTP